MKKNRLCWEDAIGNVTYPHSLAPFVWLGDFHNCSIIEERKISLGGSFFVYYLDL